MKRVIYYDSRVVKRNSNNAKLHSLNKFIQFGTCIFDRRPIDKNINKDILDFDVKVVTPLIPKIGFSKDLEAVCRDRVLELEAIGKPIHIYYSGGIDSSLILAAFHKYSTNKDLVTIVYTYDSLRDFNVSRDLFLMASREIKTMLQKNTDLTTFNNGDVIRINGTGSEMFHGHHDQINNLRKEGKDTQPYNYDDSLINDLLIGCPYEIVDRWDVYYWIIFNLSFQNSQFNGMTQRRIGYDYKYNCSFFNTDDFQQWFLANKDYVKKDKMNKTIFKDHIIKWTGLVGYVNTHKIESSIKNSKYRVLKIFEDNSLLVKDFNFCGKKEFETILIN